MSQDPLYEKLAAKIASEDEAVKEQISAPPKEAPLEGIEEIVTVMEAIVARKMNNKRRSIEWQFFDRNGDAVSAKGGSELDPRATVWWHTI